ncbi:cytochrome P450 [Archangium sp.]|uniref:cytochrome P450 family protein n=1 Tax=Archangium sp. TaxID=1872627 RepID=UPI002D52B84C|nr:cytochrome P450 [Archangium sp.]HYO55537.1 cytochrome P450 [Archangium sp.]
MTGNAYDLWTPAHRANPRPLYARLRQEAPVVRLVEPVRQAPFWLVSRYEDVVALLRDGRLAKDSRKLSPQRRSRFFRLSQDALTRHMLNADPPDHTRLRTLVSQAFTPRRIEALRPRITALASGLLEAALAQGSVDFIDAFAFPLPVIVIAEMLGVPVEDRDPFRAWTHTLLVPQASGGLERIKEAGENFVQYFTSLLERRRAEPGDDLVSALLAAEEQGDRLRANELTGMLFLLLVAGHETTVNLLGTGLLALLQHPEQLERLRADPGLMDTAVEEMLRYCSPVETSTTRFTVEPLELRGQMIPAEEMVVLGLLSANHDPEVFAEPERFDVGRTPNKHVGFGFGIHYCLGAPLARLEAAVAFGLLLERAPRMELAVAPEHLEWRKSAFIRGLEKLPVSLG